jgi:membrane-bound metal-dependent hydrolase YbcI (DUF457 family)
LRGETVTLPEHIICSSMLAQFGVQRRFGWRGTVAVVAAGITPDLDTAAKLVSDREFWRLHHALGHGLLPVCVLSAAVAWIARWIWNLRPTWLLWVWCLGSCLVHVFTDAIYWWGVQVFWPFSRWQMKLDWIEYLDLVVLSIWLVGAFCLYRYPSRRTHTSTITIALFAGYLGLRAALPSPPRGSFVHVITGGWMYVAPKGTPVLDWW